MTQPTTVKQTAGKNPLELISSLAIEALGWVLAFGAKKYAPDGWRVSPISHRKILGSILRHCFKRLRGEYYDYDPSCDGCKSKNCLNHSGLPHSWHIFTEAMFLIETEVTHPELDDVYTTTTLPKNK